MTQNYLPLQFTTTKNIQKMGGVTPGPNKYVSVHRDYPVNTYDYDIAPVNIQDTRGPEDECHAEIVSASHSERDAETDDLEDVIDIPSVVPEEKADEEKKEEHAVDEVGENGGKEPSVVQALLDDHERQGHVAVAGTTGGAGVSKGRASTSDLLCDSVPWDTCLEIKSPMLRLHQEIVNFCSCLAPTAEEEEARQGALDRIGDAVRALWPDSRVEVFGSFATGLYLPSSDIDAVILESACADIRQGLKMLGKYLSKKGIAVDIQTILKARVPIIKFQEKESGYQFDISFDVANGPEAAGNVRELSKVIPAMSSIVMVLKVFLQQRDLNEVYSGGIGSYALLIMVANFLQTHWSRYKARGKGELEMNAGELLLDFFRLHGRALKHEVVGISCTRGGSFFRKRSLLFHYPERPELTAVQDPNDADNDLGKNSYNAVKVKMAFDYAYTRLLALPKPGESMLARIIRLDSMLFHRYKGDGEVAGSREKSLPPPSAVSGGGKRKVTANDRVSKKGKRSKKKSNNTSKKGKNKSQER